MRKPAALRLDVSWDSAALKSRLVTRVVRREVSGMIEFHLSLKKIDPAGIA
jgi:hypothetical protein